MNQTELLMVLPEGSRRHLDPSSPMPMRMMAARGMAPLPPAELVIVVCGLSLDADAAVAEAARASLIKLPEKILISAIDGKLPSGVYSLLAPAMEGKPALQQKLVLNRAVPDDAIVAIAATAPAEVAEIIANNQERCMRSEPLVRAIAQNPNLLRSSRDMLFDFLVRAGVVFGDMQEFAEAIARLSPTEMLAAADKITLPAEVDALIDRSVPGAAPAPGPTLQAALGHEEEVPAERMSSYQLVASLNVSQKVALALKGNKEVRTLLVRDSNRVVASAAVRSPRLTEEEVVKAAASRSVSDEVIRIISNSKELCRTYTVKLALVNNPKTPMPVAMRFLALLRESDIKAVAKSKNVSSAVSAQAKRLMTVKNPKG